MRKKNEADGNPIFLAKYVAKKQAKTDRTPRMVTAKFPAEGFELMLDVVSFGMSAVVRSAESAVAENDMEAMEDAGTRWSALVATVDYLLHAGMEAKCVTRGAVRHILPQLQQMTKELLQCIKVAKTRCDTARPYIEKTLAAWGIS